MDPIDHLIEEIMALEQHESKSRDPSRKLKENNQSVGVEEISPLNHNEFEIGELFRKLKETPFIAFGIIGLIGAYALKKHPLYASLNPNELRALGNRALGSSLAGGICYTLFRSYTEPAIHAPVACFRRLDRQK